MSASTVSLPPADMRTTVMPTEAIAWAKLMARVGEEFPLEYPGCGGDSLALGEFGEGLRHR
jgi:hypothetical protein